MDGWMDGWVDGWSSASGPITPTYPSDCGNTTNNNNNNNDNNDNNNDNDTNRHAGPGRPVGVAGGGRPRPLLVDVPIRHLA